MLQICFTRLLLPSIIGLFVTTEEISGCGFKNTDDSLGKELDYYKDFLNWGMDGEKHPVCSNAHDWLVANKPELQKISMCWGDSRIGNVLYKDYKASALLDWEMTCSFLPFTYSRFFLSSYF